MTMTERLLGILTGGVDEKLIDTIREDRRSEKKLSRDKRKGEIRQEWRAEKRQLKQENAEQTELEECDTFYKKRIASFDEA